MRAPRLAPLGRRLWAGEPLHGQAAGPLARGFAAEPARGSTAPAVDVAGRPQAGAGFDRGRYFTKTHEWFEVLDEGIGTVGVTQVAQRALGEVVFCRLPRVGERVSVMQTLVTLEAVKTVGEVHAPVFGEVLEVNPRLEREPALVTFAPLTEGWLVRLAFSGRIPKYLRRSRAVARADVEHLLEDDAALTAWLQGHFGLGAETQGDPAGAASDLRELTFDGLTSWHRFRVHVCAEQIGLVSSSRGVGPSRQLVITRPQAGGGSESSGDEGDEEGGEDERQPDPPAEAEPPVPERSEGPGTRGRESGREERGRRRRRG